MRNLIITREKSFVACFGVMKVYIEDRISPETTINDTPCRKLGTLKNGEQKSFSIDNTGARIFVIADKLSKGFCNEFFDVPAGDFDVALKGKNHYNPMAGNPFRFEGTENEEVLANRKKTKRKSYIVMAIAFVVGIIIGLINVTLNSEETSPETFTRDGMSITLTSEFIYVPQDGFTACYGDGDYSVLVTKEDFSLFPENTTIEDYIDFVLAESPDIEVFDHEGLIYFEYAATSDDSGTEYYYFSTVFETDDAFWLIQFATEPENYEEAFPLFVEWAKTVAFE